MSVQIPYCMKCWSKWTLRVQCETQHRDFLTTELTSCRLQDVAACSWDISGRQVGRSIRFPWGRNTIASDPKRSSKGKAVSLSSICGSVGPLSVDRAAEFATPMESSIPDPALPLPRRFEAKTRSHHSRLRQANSFGFIRSRNPFSFGVKICARQGGN